MRTCTCRSPRAWLNSRFRPLRWHRGGRRRSQCTAGAFRWCAIVLVCAVGARTAPAEEFELPAVVQVGQDGVVSAELIYQLAGRPTPQCHASTIVETSAGLVAAWFGGTEEGHDDVGIWMSRQFDGRWSHPVLIAGGFENESRDYPCWNPVLFQPQGGPLMLFYKVGPNPRQWWGVVTTSDDAGMTWSAPRRLGTSPKLFPANRNLIGPVKNKPLQLEDASILCPGSTENEGWRVHFELSQDMGKTYEVIGPLLDGEPLDAIQPSILTHGDGRLQILCRTRQGVLATNWSSDRGRTWGPMRRTHIPNPNSGTDAVTLDSHIHLLVYNHSHRTASRNGRQVLNVATSPDGENWRVVLTLEHEGHPAGYSYPAVIQTRDGLVHITYTWRRQSIKHVVLDPSRLPAGKVIPK
ncbi:MAG: sialidase [Planctomycetota bacterium]|nr:MAG: sialidase [Planctomycetota bacterium]